MIAKGAKLFKPGERFWSALTCQRFRWPRLVAATWTGILHRTLGVKPPRTQSGDNAGSPARQPRWGARVAALQGCLRPCPYMTNISIRLAIHVVQIPTRVFQEKIMRTYRSLLATVCFALLVAMTTAISTAQ